jgi:tripartite-type tricarboxylate transporter receptor subunit TctC
MIHPHRRHVLQLAAAAAALPVLPRRGRALDYPTQPVRIIVPYAAGGSPDTVARLMGQWLAERFGQQFVIENRPGAGGNIGTEAVVRAAPDGHTLLYITTANAISPAIFSNLKFNFLRDIAPVAGIIGVPNLVSVNPSLPIATIRELIAYAKANPGKLNFGGPTAGTIRLSGELFNMMAQVKLVHVPYTNQMQAVTDLLTGRMQVSFDIMPATIEHARAGKLRALAVTSGARSPALPDLPTVGESVPGYEASSLNALGAPKGTPAAVVATLNHAVNAILAEPKVVARLGELGGVPMAMTPAQLGTLLAEETEKWAKVVKFADVQSN